MRERSRSGQRVRPQAKEALRNVAAILRNKGNAIETIRPDWLVSQACTRLTELRIGALVVSEYGRQVHGIISERDVIRHIARAGADILDLRIFDIMIRKVITCTSEDNITHLMETMIEHRIRHLPVAEGDLVIFPGWLDHEVPINQSDADRVSIAFNVMFRGYGEAMSRPMWKGTAGG